ncbi:MAG: helix-turn-helix domain-containing protein [Marinosulfonomonas sp.]|nr:helix-turn-helix domain-containing protein [Marinosulfonomonas sp.]
MILECPTSRCVVDLPDWLPEAARHYLFHTESGVSIRELARRAGCHASTVMRQIRKTEARRDDPLVDDALARLGARHRDTCHFDFNPYEDALHMNVQLRSAETTAEETKMDREARRLLRRLNEAGACLAVAADMEKAVVVRETEDGRTVRTAVTDRPVVQAMALRDWIACGEPGRVTRYTITSAGRAALKRLLAEDDAARAGFSEAATPFADQHRSWDQREMTDPGTNTRRQMRYNLAESPVAAIARRKDKAGQPFLSVDLVSAAERLREDFELAQMGPRVAQNWDKFLTGGDRGSFSPSGGSDGGQAAKDRVAAVLRDLGPGLGDVVLRVCCFLEGLETAEKRMGWSARSGKIVLRIALQRLKRHYDGQGKGDMIG